MDPHTDIDRDGEDTPSWDEDDDIDGGEAEGNGTVWPNGPWNEGKAPTGPAPRPPRIQTGGGAYPSPSRPVYAPPPPAVPVWAKAEEYPETYRLRIKRQEPDGTLSDLGYIGKDATDVQILSKWPRPASLYIFPVDQMNREMDPNNPIRLNIPADHEFLQQRAAGIGGPGPVANAALAGLPPELFQLFQGLLSSKDAEVAAERERAREREAKLQEREAELQQQQAALAINQVRQLASAHDRVLEGYEEKSNTLLAQMRAQNEAERIRLQADAERERARMEAQHAMLMAQMQAISQAALQQQQQAYTMYMDMGKERDKTLLQIQKERETERQAALEAERARIEREEKWRLETSRQDDERRREHLERMYAGGGFGNLKEQVGSLKEVTEALGIGEDKGVVGQVIEAVTEMQKARMQYETARLQAMANMDPEDLEDLSPQELAELGLLPPGAIPPQGFPGQPGFQGQGPQALPAPQQPIPGHLQQGQPVEVGIGHEHAWLNQGGNGGNHQGVNGGNQAQSVQRRPDPNLPMQVIKKARVALRTVVTLLRREPEAKWAALVQAALVETPEAVEYLKAVSIRYACQEAGADAELTSRICMAVEMMANSFNIPLG